MVFHPSVHLVTYVGRLIYLADDVHKRVHTIDTFHIFFHLRSPRHYNHLTNTFSSSLLLCIHHHHHQMMMMILITIYRCTRLTTVIEVPSPRCIPISTAPTCPKQFSSPRHQLAVNSTHWLTGSTGITQQRHLADCSLHQMTHYGGWLLDEAAGGYNRRRYVQNNKMIKERNKWTK